MVDVTLTVFRNQLVEAVQAIEDAAKLALRAAANVVQASVIDLTPRWKGGLQSHILIRPQEDGRIQEVFAEGVVAAVHENNGTWSKFPPPAPIQEWVRGKLGITGEKENRSVAFLVARKIFQRGLTLPNKEGKGIMFRRAFERQKASRGYLAAFKAAFVGGVRGFIH